MKTKFWVSMFLFFMPMVLVGCGGGNVSKEPPADLKQIVEKRDKVFQNMQKAKQNPSR